MDNGEYAAGQGQGADGMINDPDAITDNDLANRLLDEHFVNLPKERVAEYITEYLVEMRHGSYEGFNKQDEESIISLLADITRWFDACLEMGVGDEKTDGDIELVDATLQEYGILMQKHDSEDLIGDRIRLLQVGDVIRNSMSAEEVRRQMKIVTDEEDAYRAQV